MIVGYARISDRSQEIGTQVEQLKQYGCQKIVQEVITGVAEDKLLNQLVEKLEEGSTLVSTRVDRLGRSAIQVLQLAQRLKEKNIHLVVLDLGIDTRTLAGELVLTVMASISEWERKNNKEKQLRGIALAKKKGKHLGRRAEWSKEGLQEALQDYLKGEKSVNQISDIYKIPRSTLYYFIKKAEIKK